MKASWNGQICKSEDKYGIQFETDKYGIQFETDNYHLYQDVERACQDAVDACNVLNRLADAGQTYDISANELRTMLGGDMDAKYGIEMSGMRACDILPEHGGMEMPAVSASSVLPRVDKGMLHESDDSSLE